jgi:hypothetical protein
VDSFKDLKLLKGSSGGGGGLAEENVPNGKEEAGGESAAASPLGAILETGGPAVPPLYTMQGVRDYACSLCPGLLFRLLEGPGSVKEHLAAVH